MFVGHDSPQNLGLPLQEYLQVVCLVTLDGGVFLERIHREIIGRCSFWYLNTVFGDIIYKFVSSNPVPPKLLKIKYINL
jgi:hypothetical protein